MSVTHNPVQLPIRAVRMALFPTLSSPEAVLSLAESQLPIIDKNTIVSLLLAYHNTLLALAEKERNDTR